MLVRRREVEKRFDARSSSFDPSKRVVADNSFNPDRFVEVKYDPSKRVESVDSNELNKENK
jgi:hypothetical protein